MTGTVTVQPGTVTQPPVITTQPSSQTVTAGANVVFIVAATGTPPLTYQWRKNGNDIPGATGSSLTLNAVSSNAAGSYSVLVGSPDGSTPSANAVLTVQPVTTHQPPVIATQPSNQTVTAGANVVFTVAATGTPPLTYQWRKNGNDIPGATGSSLTLNAVSSNDAGSYSVLVGSPDGSTPSANAVLTVQPVTTHQPPVIATQPSNQTVTAGANVVFMVAATGTPPLTYQWRKNGNDIPGATGSSLTLNAVSSNDAGSYSVLVGSPDGSTPSANATLTVQPVSNQTFVTGMYNGLFFVPNAVAQSSSGSISIKTTAKGAFSGSLQAGGRRLPLSGQFDGSGAANKTISPKGATPLTVMLQLDANDPDKMTGTVSDGVFTANLTADRAVFDGRAQIAPQAGSYTLSIAGNDDSSVAPGGDGVAMVRVDKAGKVLLAGSLAEGTKLSQTTVISKDGNWPLYVTLYGGQGFILGLLTFAGSSTEAISGNVIWSKPANGSAKFYPAGFQLNTTASGFHYSPPAAGNNVLTLTDAALTLSGGDLTQDVSEQIMIGPMNKVMDSSGRKLSIAFAPSTGTFKGRVIDTATQQPISVNGVALQGPNVGTGYFLGASKSGKVTLTSP